MKNIVLSLCLYIFCFLVIGLYTLIIYLIGQTFWPEKTKGSLIIDKNSNIRGSYLVHIGPSQEAIIHKAVDLKEELRNYLPLHNF